LESWKILWKHLISKLYGRIGSWAGKTNGWRKSQISQKKLLSKLQLLWEDWYVYVRGNETYFSKLISKNKNTQ